jgi:hypothetical protein
MRFHSPLVLIVSALSLAACSSDTPTGTPSAPRAASPVVVAAPAIGLDPTSLGFFMYVFRSSSPPSQTLNITNLGGGTLAWTATSNRSWLKIGPKSGTAPSSVTVSVDRAALWFIGYNGYRPGSLKASITVSAAGASNTLRTVPVTLFLRYY